MFEPTLMFFQASSNSAKPTLLPNTVGKEPELAIKRQTSNGVGYLLALLEEMRLKRILSGVAMTITLVGALECAYPQATKISSEASGGRASVAQKSSAKKHPAKAASKKPNLTANKQISKPGGRQAVETKQSAAPKKLSAAAPKLIPKETKKGAAGPSLEKVVADFEKSVEVRPATEFRPSKSTTLKKGPDGQLYVSGDVSLSGGGQSYADTHLTNETNDRLSLVDVRGFDGGTVATLYVTGKEAIFDTQGQMVSGSGYAEASPGNYFHIVFTGSDGNHVTQIQIGVSRIDWDASGQAISVHGLEPILKQLVKADRKILSDLTNPTLHGSVLQIKTSDGAVFLLNTSFGRGDKFKIWTPLRV